MKWKLLLLLLGILVIGGGFYLYQSKSSDKDTSSSKTETSSILKVSAQTVQDTVVVDAVTMPANGFVVARAIDGNRLSQVIEISRYLEKGTYENITITLGDFYNGEELIVMIYADDGDGVFNDNDQPFKDASGNMIARYVATGEVVPTSMMQPDPNAMAGHVMGGSMITVRYTDNGFIPATLEVPVGTMVQFINESNDVMWVASDDHPGHEILSTFDQFGPAEKNGSYAYTFDKPGNWAYHDHINPEREAEIEVR